ncbi:MAG: hypothetical protein AAF517_03020 [Planctomycetota bacterium]
MRARKRRLITAWLCLTVLATGGFAIADETTNDGGLTDLSSRFEREIWPLFGNRQKRLSGRGTMSCLSCHDSENSSDLRFLDTPSANFKMLLEGGYFDQDNRDSLLRRVGAKKLNRRMPPRKYAAWPADSIAALERFARDAAKLSESLDGKADERFPSALLEPYTGVTPDGLDNTFLSYRQLRGKIQVIFGDEWVRGGEDRFAKNIALFGGADFRTRFDEDTRASAGFLSALDALARDVSSRSYATRSGPFEGHDPDVSSSEDFDRQIRRIFRRIIYRDPSQDELAKSRELVRGVLSSESSIESTGYDLEFEVTARDESTGLESRKNLLITVSGGDLSVHTEQLDQSRGAKSPGNQRLAISRLDGSFALRARNKVQALRIRNEGTARPVSFHSVRLTPRSSQPSRNSKTKTIELTVDSPSVQLVGAWSAKSIGSSKVYDDLNENKGGSYIRVGLEVPETGEYSIDILWKYDKNLETSVPIDVLHYGSGKHVLRQPEALPPAGEAHYFVDQSVDSEAFTPLGDRFRFDKTGAVVISNRGTTRRVTADAVRFVADRSPTILVDNHEADGRDGWQTFKARSFRAYNRIGKDSYHDANSKKGELELVYRPSIKNARWKPSIFYKPQVGFPAKRDHETHTPIIVRAEASSPILRVRAPRYGDTRGEITIDASTSFTVQRSPLLFSFRQTSGPRVSVAEGRLGAGQLGKMSERPALRFVAAKRDVREAAWTGLARALLFHPDFLFTRPPSVATTSGIVQKRRLQLVKISLDLLARPPRQEEIDAIDSGTTLSEIVDRYLASEEFRSFYFHRIRLYLESHGDSSQDEPVRIWSYVAFQDRPIEEILTANYTVNENFERKSRDEHYGRSGVLTTAGFIQGKPGLPHFNYAAQVAEKFLGFVFEVPPDIPEGATAAATTAPDSTCYSCHKLLTPLAFQRSRWDDSGRYRPTDESGKMIDDSDQGLVASYPFAGRGMEAFALQAVKKERFLRTMINAHFIFYFGREMRHAGDERVLYRKLWDATHASGNTIRGLIRAIVSLPEYLEGRPQQGSGTAAPPAQTTGGGD